MRPFAVLAFLAVSACAPPDESTASISDEAAPTESVSSTADPAPEATEDAATDAASGDAVSSDAASGDIAPGSGSVDGEAEVRGAVSRFLADSVDDGPPAPDLEAWADQINIEGTAGYYVGTPAIAADVEAFESFCGGIAAAIAPGEGGIVRAVLRRGTAGGWTVIDSEVCYEDGRWATWEEEYSLPAGLAVEYAE